MTQTNETPMNHVVDDTVDQVRTQNSEAEQSAESASLNTDTWFQLRQQLPLISQQIFGAHHESLAKLVNNLLPQDQLADLANMLIHRVAEVGQLFVDGHSIDEEKQRLATEFSLLGDRARLYKMTMALEKNNVRLAVVEGVVSSFLGTKGGLIDVPAMLVLCARVTHEMGLAYGIDVDSELGEKRIQNVLASIDFSILAHKQALLFTMNQAQGTVNKFLHGEEFNALYAWAGQHTDIKRVKAVVDKVTTVVETLFKPQIMVMTKVVPVARAVVGGFYNAKLIKNTVQQSHIHFSVMSDAEDVSNTVLKLANETSVKEVVDLNQVIENATPVEEAVTVKS